MRRIKLAIVATCTAVAAATITTRAQYPGRAQRRSQGKWRAQNRLYGALGGRHASSRTLDLAIRRAWHDLGQETQLKP